jgi:flagellar hook protein FlgE
MMRSMFSAISGLKNHQTFMDVIGNNIANVNTTGFKQSRVTFQDILSQNLRGGSGPQAGRGGINPEQVGLGVLISGIDTVQTQGTLQSTGKLTDMAIQGDGYFVMSDGKQTLFTRDGAFDLGIDGKLTNPASGLRVLGWQADSTGKIDTTGPAGDISLPIGAGMTGRASTDMSLTGNLDASSVPAASGATPTTSNQATVSGTIYDSLGNSHKLTYTFAPTAAGSGLWNVTVAKDPSDASLTGTPSMSPAQIKFNANGKPVDASGNDITETSFTLSGLTLNNNATIGGATPGTIDINLTGMTQLSSASDVTANTDGSSSGSLTTFTVGPSGEITGVYSNGYKQSLGQIAMASFSNPSGLVKAGGNLFGASPNSGTPVVGTPGSGSRGTIATGFLEGSNVDLAQQFTNMIMAERGFQANSRVITTSDEILQDLVNLKH